MQSDKTIGTKLTSLGTAILLAALSLISVQSDGAIAASPKTVTFNANSGTGTMSAQTSNTSTSLTLNTFTRAGYTFSNWNTAANGSGTSYADGATYSFAADITLYAQWTALPTYVVTFNSNGGSGSMSPQTSYGPTVLAVNTFTRAGYSFNTWNTAADGSGKTYTDGGNFPFNENTTLYAQWIPLPTKTVTFNANGGTGSMSAQTSYSTTSLSPNTFTRLGYTFASWNTASNGSGTSYADGASYSFSADITLYAQWTALPTYTVTFNSNGGIGSMSVQTSNVTASLTLNTFTRSGYTFSGWNTSATASGTSYADGATYSFSADITLYAQWTAIPTHTVTFNANGGIGSMSAQASNVTANLTLNTFARSGYTFVSWNTVANGSGTAYTDGASYSFASDLTLYAQWTAFPTHTVTFNANGGIGSMSAQTSNVSAALSANTFTRSGYTFIEWNTAVDGSGAIYADGAAYAFTSDISLYAQWTALPTFTVTFNPNGGSGSMSAQTSNISAALSANVFTYAGYTFIEWNTAANGSGTIYADGAIFTFTSDITLYAQWTALPTFTVTFDSNGGNGTMLPQVEYAPSKLNGNTFNRAGYTFHEWNSATDGKGKKYADEANFPFNENVTLYAQWTALPTFTVTFDSNGGNGLMLPQVEYETANLNSVSFTRAEYTFAGWNTAADGSGTTYADGASYAFAADLTLYAQWTPIPVGDTVIPLSFQIDGTTFNVTVTIPVGVKSGSTLNLIFAPSGNSTSQFPMISITEANGLDDFDKPIAIELPNYMPGAKLYYTNGSSDHKLIPEITTSDLATLCATPKATGYIDNGATITIYTCHLSSYGYRQEQSVLTLAPSTGSIAAGGTTQLNAGGGSGNLSYTYSTTTSSVCTVSVSGLVTAITAGTCLVTVNNPASGTYIEKTSSVVTITVTAATPSGGGGGGGGGGASSGGSGGNSATYLSQPSVSIASAESTIQLTKTTKLTVTGGAGSGVVTYSTTTTEICSVTNEGVVTGLKAGTCNVRATKAASGTYLEANTPYITVTVSDSEQRAADEAAAKAEAERLATAKEAADAAAAALASAEAAAAAASKVEADRLALLATNAALAEQARLAMLYKNQITWKRVGKYYKVNYNLSSKLAWQLITIKVGSKVKGKLVYKTTNWLALNGSGDGVITQSKVPVKGSYYRIVLGKKVVYTQLIK